MELDLFEVTSKIRGKREATRFCLELGKISILIIGFILPDEKIFSCEFFYQFLSSNKKLLKIEEYCDITIPNYITIPELQKPSLLLHSKSNPSLRKYLPDADNLESISRQFLLKVSYL